MPPLSDNILVQDQGLAMGGALSLPPEALGVFIEGIRKDAPMAQLVNWQPVGADDAEIVITSNKAKFTRQTQEGENTPLSTRAFNKVTARTNSYGLIESMSYQLVRNAIRDPRSFPANRLVPAVNLLAEAEMLGIDEGDATYQSGFATILKNLPSAQKVTWNGDIHTFEDAASRAREIVDKKYDPEAILLPRSMSYDAERARRRNRHTDGAGADVTTGAVYTETEDRLFPNGFADLSFGLGRGAHKSSNLKDHRLAASGEIVGVVGAFSLYDVYVREALSVVFDSISSVTDNNGRQVNPRQAKVMNVFADVYLGGGSADPEGFALIVKE